MVRSQFPRTAGQRIDFSRAARRREEGPGHQGRRRRFVSYSRAIMRFRLAGVTAISVALALVTAYARVPQGRGGGGIPVPQVTPVPQSGQSQSGPLPPPLVATGLVVGRVIDATSGEPVAGAVVMMSGGPSRMPPVPS